MPKNIKDKWVAALRSGDYKQGREWLVVDDKYCCLGVLCDVVKDNFDLTLDNDAFIDSEGERFPMVLPPVIANAYFNGDRVPGVMMGTHEDGTPYGEMISEVNDVFDYDFNQIADLIEAQY